MTLPTLIFGGLVATLYGAIFHLIRGGGLGKLLLYILLSWAGFFLGQYIGERTSWEFINIGALNLGIATITSVLFMIAGYWIFKGRPQSE
jgi:hypothetical protein